MKNVIKPTRPYKAQDVLQNHLKKAIKDKVIAFKLPHIFDQPAFVKYNAYQRDIVTHAAVNKGSLLGLQHSTKLAY